MNRKLLVALCFIVISFGLSAQFSATVSNALCFNYCNGSVQIMPDSGYRYKWSSGDSTATGTKDNLCAGTYYCTVSDTLGLALDTLQFIVHQPSPLTDVIAADTVSCYGASDAYIIIVAIGGIPPYTYMVRTILTLDTGYAVDSAGFCPNLPQGGYLIRIVDANGCTVADTTSINQPNTPCTGIRDIKPLLNFSTQPNPVTDVINVVYGLNEPIMLRVAIYDMSGRKIKDVLNDLENTGQHIHLVNIKELAAGNYLLSVMSDKGSFTTKFLKE